MNNKNYTTTLLVENSAKEVFDAINNVRGWWQGEITGSTDKLNDEFTYEMRPHHLSTQKIVASVRGEKVVWLVIASKINFVADRNEWLNTKISFDIAAVGDKTKLTFTHEGLVPGIECYGGCSGAWEQLVQKSLFGLITTGKGVNVF